MKHFATHPISWRALVLVILGVLVPATSGGTRPSAMAGGGGGVEPTPPLSPADPLGTLTTPPGENLRVPLVVVIDGPSPSYIVVVTAPSGAVVASIPTNAQGVASLKLPGIAGLELDVIGTSVVGLPVHAGQTVAITIP